MTIESNTQKEKNFGRNGSIDLFRLLVSMVIVMIHFGIGVKIYSPVYNTLGRMGVPFFFLVTGYFYFSKSLNIDFNWQYYKKYMMKTFQIWIFWSCFYIPRLFLVKQEPVTPFILIRSLYGLSATCGPLWYLIAAAEALALVHLTFRKLGKKWLIAFVLVAWVLCLFGSAYLGLFSHWKSVINVFQLIAPETSVFAAYFWFGIALLFVSYKDYFAKLPALKFFGACTFLWAFEVLIINHFNLIRSTDMYIMLLPESVLFLNLLLTYPVHVSSQTAKLLRDFSLYIYILQILSGDIVNWTSRLANIYHPENSFFYYWIVLIVDIIFATLVISIERLYKRLRKNIILKNSVSSL